MGLDRSLARHWPAWTQANISESSATGLELLRSLRRPDWSNQRLWPHQPVRVGELRLAFQHRTCTRSRTICAPYRTGRCAPQMHVMSACTRHTKPLENVSRTSPPGTIAIAISGCCDQRVQSGVARKVESHPRQWVGSFKSFLRSSHADRRRKPTHGSGLESFRSFLQGR